MYIFLLLLSILGPSYVYVVDQGINKCSGLILDNRYILTAYHCAQQFDSIRYDKQYTAKLDSFDEKLDLAIVKTDVDIDGEFNKPRFKNPDPNMVSNFYGKCSPYGRPTKFLKSVNVEILPLQWYVVDEWRATRGAHCLGDSGGIFVSNNGVVLGLLIGISQNYKQYSYASSAETIEKFLKGKENDCIRKTQLYR